MNFFEHQDVARKRSGQLVILFALAVIAIYAVLYAVATAAYNASDAVPTGQTQWLVPELAVGVGFFVLLTVGGGSLFKIRQLAGGGASVALSVGGRLINPETTDHKERQLLNVVEEMAIASGVPVPLVFVMDDESGINAFAAGYTMNDAAVAVTRGTLDSLSRDELQGVIAHEFSHILNGDMKLNIRLMGVLAGILLIGNMGMWIVRSSGRTRSRGRNNGGGIVLVGAVLAAVGFVGVFFGRLIQSAVSRQREFLADASAVQFTRNPDGIGGALKKIGNIGSSVGARDAGEMSHMFFSNALRGNLMVSLMATHPPLEERISRIDRNFAAERQMQAGMAQQAGPAPAGASGFAGGGAPSAPRPASGERAALGAATAAMASGSARTRAKGATMRIDPAQVVGRVGTISADHIAYSRDMLNNMPQELRLATRSLMPAVGIIYALLLDPTDMDVRNKQIRSLAATSHPMLVQETKRALRYVDGVNPSVRMPLVEMTLPTLRQLSPVQFAQFKRELRLLIDADNEISAFEFALEAVLLHRLDDPSGVGNRGRVKHNNVKTILYPIQLLFSVLARVGATHPDEILAAYKAGVSRLPALIANAELLPPDHCRLDRLGGALAELEQSAPHIKRLLVDAASHTVLQDGEVTVGEAELLRAIATSLDAPLPPFVA